MRVREYVQESRIDIGTSGTKTFNLDYDDPISQIDLYFEGTNGTSGNKENPFERCISKIELVDGGEVLWDLPGEVALAAFVHDNGAFPYSEAEEAQGASVRQQFPIRFGLKLFDPVYAFDPRKHTNPQLKFTFDEAAVRAAGLTGWNSDTWTFTLHVRLMEGAPAPKGFLSYRTVESYTQPSVAGARRVELPVDRAIRYLICRAFDEDVAVYSSITHHKLSMNGGKWVPFDLAARDFMNRMCETFDPVTRLFTGFIDPGDRRQTFIGIPLNGYVQADLSGVFASANFYIDGTVLVYRTTNDGIDNPGMTYIANTGWALHNTLIYPFGDRMNPADWLVPDANGKLDYFVTNGSGDGDVDICLQQVYKY